MRSFIRFAAAGLLDAAVLDAVPAVRSSKQARVPSAVRPWPLQVDRDDVVGGRRPASA